MKESSIHDELKELSPLLSQLKEKADPMTTPSGYFEQNIPKILAQIETPSRTTSAWGIWTRPLQWAAAAAVAAIAVAVWGFWEQPAIPDAAVAQVAPVVTETVQTEAEYTAAAEDYVRENILEFDEALLLEVLETEELAEIQISTSKKSKKKTLTADEHEIDEILDELTEEELEDLL